MINILKVSDNICFITHQGCSAWSIITGNLEESDQLCCKIAESIQNIYQRNNWLQAYPKYLQDNKASSSLTVIPNPPELTPLDKDSKEGNHGASLSPQAISFDSHPSPESLRPAEPVILPICTNVQDIAEIADNLNNKNELEEIKNPTAITEPALKISPKETNISKALINSETIPLSIDTNTKANTGTMVMPTYLPIPLLLPQTQYWELSTLIPPLEWQYLPHIFKFQHPLQSSIPQFNPVKNSELTQSPALKPDKETKRLGHRNVPSREEDFRSLRFLRDIDGFQNATAEDFTVLVRNSCYNRLRTMTRSASNALPRLEATLYKNWTQEKVNKMIVSITPIRVNSHYSNSQTPTSRDLLKDLTVKVLIKFQSYFLSNGWQYKDFNIKGIKNPFSYINNRDNALSEAMLLFLDLRGTKHSITFFNSSSVPSENLGKTQPLAPSEYPRKKIKCTHANSADVNNQSQSICLKFQT